MAALTNLVSPRVLLVAGGGCTALALQAAVPAAQVTLVDPNPAQLAHTRAKVRARETGAPSADWGVGAEGSLSSTGRFEALFRGLRAFLHEFVASEATWVAACRGQAGVLNEVRLHPWWPTAFELFFSDAMLERTFGSAAIQHAEPGSYPGYFRRMIERGMQHATTTGNPFLDHVLLGWYRPGNLPSFLGAASPPKHNFRYVQGSLQSLDHLGEFDLVHLSNLLDWTHPAEAAQICQKLAAEVKSGARITLRQLNNERAIERDLPGFTFECWAGDSVYEVDRSLFYQRILVGAKA